MSMDAPNRANGWAAQRKQAIEQAKQNREDRKANLAKVGEMSVAHEIQTTHLTRVTSSENQRDYNRAPMDFPINSRKPATMKYGMSLLDQPPSEEDLIQARTSLRLLKSKMKNSNGFPTMERESNDFMNRGQPQGRMGQGYNYNEPEQGDNKNYRKVFKPAFKEEDYNQINNSLNKDLHEIDKTLSQKTRVSNYAGPSQGNYNSQANEPPQQSRNRDYAKPPIGGNRNSYDPNPPEDFQDFSSKNIPSRIPKNTASASKAKPSSVYDEDYTSQYSKPKYSGNKNVMGDESPPSRGNYQNYDYKPQQQKMQDSPFGKNNFNSAFDKPNNQNREWSNNNYNNNNNNRQTYDNRDNDNSNVFSKPNLKKPQPSANPPSYQQNARQVDDDFDSRQLKNPNPNNSIPSEFAPRNNEPLEECPVGCGRKFNAEAIEKHARICQKVFQSKRKKFDSAEQRQSDDQPESGYDNKYNPPKSKASAPKASTGKSAKWKQQSEAFRANLKAARGAPLSQEEQVKLAQANQEHLVPCPTCGRKFSDQAAARHIPFCQSKTKMDNMKKGGKAKK